MVPMSRQAFKYKLYHADRNRRLDRQRRIAGQIWNHCIALHKRYYRRYRKHLNQKRLKSRIAYLRNHLRPEWKNLGSQAVQDVIERIERGYELFFKACRLRKEKKSKRVVRPPSFRKGVKYRSFTLKQAGWKLLSPGKVRIGGAAYRYHAGRDIDGTIKTVTISRDAVGDFWIIFSVETDEPSPNRAATGRTAGFDFGLKRFLTGSDDTTVEMPEPLKSELKRVKKANRRLSRKLKKSGGRKKARLSLARLHRQIADRRREFHHQTARALSRKYDVICIEDLNLTGMKSLWGRKVSDLGFAQFVDILAHHCRKNGSRLVKIDRFFPSSKTCSVCGHIHRELSLRDRTWECPSCGSLHDRDKNAAINIEREGLRLIAPQAGHRLEGEAA